MSVVAVGARLRFATAHFDGADDQIRRWYQAEMFPGARGRHPAPGGAGDQPGAHQERFTALFHGGGLLADRDRQRRDTHRSPAEATHERTEDSSVEPVETELVDVVDLERRHRD